MLSPHNGLFQIVSKLRLSKDAPTFSSNTFRGIKPSRQQSNYICLEIFGREPDGNFDGRQSLRISRKFQLVGNYLCSIVEKKKSSLN